VKRLTVLLIVVAGALAAAALAVPSTAATVNGVSISQQSLNSDLAAIANSPDYQCFMKAEQAVETDGQTALPAVYGPGQVAAGEAHPTVTTKFADSYLDTEIVHQLILQVAATDHVHPTAQELSTARTDLAGQISGILTEVEGSAYACGTTGVTGKAVLATLPSSFVAQNARFDAEVSLLEEDAAGVGSSAADLVRYFGDHPAEFATACFTVAEYSSASAAAAGRAATVSGTPFAQEATAAGGGPQGCAVLYALAEELPAAADLEGLAVNTVSQPIADGEAYILIEITKKTPSSFAAAESAVEAAVQNAGASKTQAAVEVAEKRASVSVNPRYGRWTAAHDEITPPSSPLLTDLLNGSIDGPAATTASSGQNQ
jgi:hypothetical protein